MDNQYEVFSRFSKMGRYLLSRQNYFRIRFGKGIDHSPENMSSSIDNNSSKSPFIMYGKHWRILSIGQSHHSTSAIVLLHPYQNASEFLSQEFPLLLYKGGHLL